MNIFKDKLNLTIIFLLIIITIVFIKNFFLYLEYNKVVSDIDIKQSLTNLEIEIKKGEGNYKMIIGDIIGIDRVSFEYVSEISKNLDSGIIIIPGISKDNSIVTYENFENLITNDNNVFIPDNFCYKEWGDRPQRDIYSNQNISAGDYCGSEEETLNIDKLLKQYKPENIEIYYSFELYPELISNFLIYLSELGFDYELIKIE